jgi:hypothetical protein
MAGQEVRQSMGGVLRRGVRKAWGCAALWKLLLVCLVSALGAGCVPPVQYQPNEARIDAMGVEPAMHLMRETLLRSINPRIMEVQISQDFLYYRYQQPILGPYGIPVGYAPALVEHQVAFLNVGRVEIFSNNLVLVRTSSDLILAQIVFGNEQDARTFADLMISFRAYRARSAR